MVRLRSVSSEVSVTLSSSVLSLASSQAVEQKQGMRVGMACNFRLQNTVRAYCCLRHVKRPSRWKVEGFQLKATPHSNGWDTEVVALVVLHARTTDVPYLDLPTSTLAPVWSWVGLYIIPIPIAYHTTGNLSMHSRCS
ncbi:hypothetical protein CC79DRAFT_662531 [Sarocladium strictum]